MKKVKWLVVAFVILVSLLSTSIARAAQEINSVPQTQKNPVFSDNEGDPERIEIPNIRPTIGVGEKFKINASIVGSDSSNGRYLRFSSSNEHTAIVDSDGTVTGKSEGKVDIYVAIEGELNSFKVIRFKVSLDEVSSDGAFVGPWIKPTSFYLSYDYTLNLKTREQEQLYAYDVVPENANDQSIRWESSNDDVATVDKNGLVKAVMPGKATITASFNDNPSVVRTAQVTVSGIKVVIDERKDPVLNIGDTKDLVQTDDSGFEDPNVSWTSSNNKVVSIIRGGSTASIKAVGKGTATITVRRHTGEQASIKVTVKAPVLAKTIKINIISATVKKGNKLNLKATVGDKNTTDKTVRWSSSNKKIATVDSKGTVTAKATGSVTITAKTTNNKVAKAKIRVPYEKTLKAGDWTVGKSIPAGRYEVSTDSNSGNLRIYRKGKRIVNVRIGISTKGSTVRSYTTTLKTGDKIKVLSMQKAIFIKK